MEFESKLKKLEEIVNKMESGSLSLEDSLKDFEKGVSLVRQCREQLKDSEKKVQELLSVDEKGKGSFKDFE